MPLHLLSVFLFLFAFFLIELPGQGVEVFTPPPTVPVTPESEETDLRTPQLGIRLIAPRNGVASGQAVLLSRSSFSRVEATLADLTASRGNQVFPASLFTVRYASQSFLHQQRNSQRPYFDTLLEESPNEGRIQPVWLTVEVPADAPAGEYEGLLRLRTSQGATQVPVKLTVVDWTVPDPSDWKTHLGMFQSPESVAQYYQVQPFSDEHFRLMEPSIKMLGKVGSTVINLPILNNNHLGSEHSIIQWVRQGNRATPQFEALRRYLEMFAQANIQPEAIILHAWEGRWRDDSRRDSFDVSGISRPGGSPTLFSAPWYLEPEAVNFWKPMYDGIRQTVEALGWDPGIIVIGHVGDRSPEPEIIEFFQTVAPYARWSMFTHSRGHPDPRDGDTEWEVNGKIVYYRVVPYAPMGNSFNGTFRPHWELSFLEAGAIRGMIYNDHSPAAFRFIPDASMGDSRGHFMKGMSYMGIDFWPLRPTDEGFRDIRSIRPFGWNNLYRGVPSHLVSAGPDGALPSVRLEMFREGMQEAEARITLEKILRDSTLRRKLRGGLADQIEAFLEDRNQKLRPAVDREWEGFENTAWMDDTARLYALVAEASQQADLTTELRAPATMRNTPSQPQAEMRTWTNREGVEINARLLRFDGENVVIERQDGQSFQAPLSLFSDADQEYVRSQAE